MVMWVGYIVMTAAAMTAGAGVVECPDGPAGLPWHWPGWDRVSTSTWGSNTSCCTTTRSLSCCSGIDSPAEAAFKTTEFDLVFVDNGIGSPGCRFAFNGGNDSMHDCHWHRSRGAAAIKAANRSTPVFVSCDLHTCFLCGLWLKLRASICRSIVRFQLCLKVPT